MYIDEGGPAGGVDEIIVDATPPATNEHDAAIAESQSEAAVEIAEVEASAAVEQTEVIAEVEAAREEVEQGVMEILSLHGENIAGLRAELAESRAENAALLGKMIELLGREEEEQTHAEEIHTEELPREGGGEGEAGGGGEGGGETDSPPERRQGRRYSRHFG